MGDRPLIQVPVSGTPPRQEADPPRHETVLPDEASGLLAELDLARRQGRPQVREVVLRHPEFIEAWARLGELELERGDVVAAYACARVAYHRGLDRLRRHGWGGTGVVRWSEPSNRGFLRGLRLVLVAAAAAGELDESERCRAFLLELDPDDGLGAAAWPDRPGPDWVAPAPPD